MVSRTYSNNHGAIDLRTGIGLYDNLGYGKIYISSSALVGYATLNKSFDDFIYYVNDSNIVEGFGSESYDVSKAHYFTLGIDFTFGYQIDFGKHLTFNLEYNPEFSYYTILDSEYYFENASDYTKNFINSNFSVFNLNLLYKF